LQPRKWPFFLWTH